MSSSDKTFPKTRRYAYIATALGTVSCIALGVLFVQVDALEREYGVIRSDLTRYVRERDDALIRRDGVLTEIAQRTLDEQRLRDTISTLTTQRDQLSSQITQQRELLPQEEKHLADVMAKARASQETITEADRAEVKLSDLKGRRAEIDKSITQAEAKLSGLAAEIDDMESKQVATKSVLAVLDREQNTRQALVTKLQSQITELSTKKQQVDELNLRQTSLADQVSSLTKDISSKQAALPPLTSQIQALDAQSTKSQTKATAVAHELSQLEATVTTLDKEIQGLESQKATLTGNLSSLQTVADRAREDASTAEGRVNAAQEALSQAQSQLAPLQLQITQLKVDKSTLTAQVDSERVEVTRLQAVKAQETLLADDVDKLKGEKTALDEAVRKLNESRAKLVTDISTDQGALNALKAELAELGGRKGTLAQELVTLNAAQIAAKTVPATLPIQINPMSSIPAQEGQQ